jgi:hypothetical protein
MYMQTSRFWFDAETAATAPPFQSLRGRDASHGIILPVRKVPDLLDFPALTGK